MSAGWCLPARSTSTATLTGRFPHQPRRLTAKRWRMSRSPMSVDRQETVSVVVTTRNSGQTLEACLRSIRRQAYEPTELVVVDNHSTDGTVEIARRYADHVATIGPERSAQRNHGATLASGALLLFIDADMVLD